MADLEFRELARESGRMRLICPGKASKLVMDVRAVMPVEVDHRLLLAESDRRPDTEVDVPTVISESHRLRGRCSAPGLFETSWGLKTP